MVGDLLTENALTIADLPTPVNSNQTLAANTSDPSIVTQQDNSTNLLTSEPTHKTTTDLSVSEEK